MPRSYSAGCSLARPGTWYPIQELSQRPGLHYAGSRSSVEPHGNLSEYSQLQLIPKGQMGSPAESWDASAERAGCLGLFVGERLLLGSGGGLSGKALHTPRRVGIRVTFLGYKGRQC